MNTHIRRDLPEWQLPHNVRERIGPPACRRHRIFPNRRRILPSNGPAVVSECRVPHPCWLQGGAKYNIRIIHEPFRTPPPAR